PQYAATGIAGVWGKETNRIVSPIISQLVIHQMLVGYKLVDRHQFHSGDAQLMEIANHRWTREAGVGPAQFRRRLRVAHGKSLDVQLIDQGPVPGRSWGSILSPAKCRVHDHTLWHSGRAVPLIS